MHKSVKATALGVVLVAATGFGAQAQEMPSEEEMMAAWQAAMEVGPVHQMLADRTGMWDMSATWTMGPGGESQTEHGTAERTMVLGGRVMEERVVSSMFGMPYEGIARNGFDNVTGELWATWTDSMSTSLTVMHGTLDDDGVIRLVGESLDPLTGQSVPMTYEVVMESPDRDVARFYVDVPGMDEPYMMMEIVYERQQ